MVPCRAHKLHSRIQPQFSLSTSYVARPGNRFKRGNKILSLRPRLTVTSRENDLRGSVQPSPAVLVSVVVCAVCPDLGDRPPLGGGKSAVGLASTRPFRSCLEIGEKLRQELLSARVTPSQCSPQACTNGRGAKPRPWAAAGPGTRRTCCIAVYPPLPEAKWCLGLQV